MIGDPRRFIERHAGAVVPPDALLEVIRRGEEEVGVAMWSHWYWCENEAVDAEVTLHMARPATPATLRAVLKTSFERLQLDRITMHPMTDESRRLGQLMGFRLEGTRRGDECDDVAMYGMTAADYRTGRFAP